MYVCLLMYVCKRLVYVCVCKGLMYVCMCMYVCSSIAFEVLSKIRDLVKSNNNGKQPLSVILSIHQVRMYECMYVRMYNLYVYAY